MIRFQDIKKGDYVIAEYEGTRWEAEVTGLRPAEREVGVQTSVQEFWFKPENLHAIPLDEGQLQKLRFDRQDNEDGSVKYMKGAFRVLLPEPGNFNRFEIWYRQEHRQILQPIAVHEFQNHYHDMTKVHLTNEAFQ
jgi:hypothetical protein